MKYNFQLESNPRSEHYNTLTIFIDGVNKTQEGSIEKLVGRPVEDFVKVFPKAIDSVKGEDLRLAVVARNKKNKSLRLWFAHSREDDVNLSDLLSL
mgnify:CR=1 FL=1|tara:strand:- start:1150 stop:1437 length:288 start_codon:yes stop_codon:yes gene_type:complete